MSRLSTYRYPNVICCRGKVSVAESDSVNDVATCSRSEDGTVCDCLPPVETVGTYWTCRNGEAAARDYI